VPCGPQGPVAGVDESCRIFMHPQPPPPPACATRLRRQRKTRGVHATCLSVTYLSGYVNTVFLLQYFVLQLLLLLVSCCYSLLGPQQQEAQRHCPQVEQEGPPTVLVCLGSCEHWSFGVRGQGSWAPRDPS
jgi:hypothetical protein